MKRITNAYSLAILLAFNLVFSVRAQTPESIVAQAHNPEIQLAWFYKPPVESILPVLRDNFDFFILTHKDEQQRDQLRAMGVTAPIYQYLLLTEIRDPGNCTAVPRGNQVAWKPGDFCMINTQHPDWFLLDSQGRRISSGEVHFLDPGNPEFRQFWLERSRELQQLHGWNELFIDNADAGLGKFRTLNRMPAKYLTDESYRNAVIGFLNYLKTNTGREIVANITSTQDYDGAWMEVLAPLDGALVENFAAGWLGRTKSRAEWEEQMDGLEQAYRQGKNTILVSQGEQNDTNRQRFSFASYLLIANQHAFFRYAKDNSYNQVWLYGNYSVDVGAPLSGRFRQGDTWRRDFLNGYVIVNPSTLDAEIVLGPTPAHTPATNTPTSSGPFVSTEVNPTSLTVGGTALVTVRLNNVPVEGYKSAEFTCTYNASLVEKSNIVPTNLFGADAAMAIHDPQNGTFIVAMAGTNGNRTTTGGPAFTFNVKGLQTGQSAIECKARVSKGDNVPIDLPSAGASLAILSIEPSPTPFGSQTSTPIGSTQPTSTNSPLESPTPTASFTAVPSLTPTPSPNGSVTGQLIASKPVTVSLLDANNVVITSVAANPDGTFSLTALAGNYTVVAMASGFLSAQGSAPIVAGSTATKPAISLLAGDIDGNNVIDQFDALTIGMSYNTLTPSAADLNNDGTINFLDLELLAENYRMTGPSVWE